MNLLRWTRLSVLPAAAVGLAACTGNPPPTPTEAPVAAAEPAEAAPAEDAPAGLPAPSIDPRPRGVAVAALPEPGVELRDPADRAGLDVTHYDLDIDLTDLADSLLVGHATLTLRAERDTIELDFVGLPVDSVRVDGRRAAFAQGPAILRIAPESGFTGEVRVGVFYHGVPRDGLFIGPDASGQVTAFADNWPNRARWWFPANDYPPDKAAATFRVRAPAGYSVVANGRLLSSEDGVWRWREDVEIPAYTMVIGVAPFERADIGAAACGEAPVGVSDECAMVSIWALPGSGAYAEERFARAPDMVDLYTELFGPYPYEKLAHVQSSTRFGGMENSSAIFYAMGAWAEERMGEGVIAHETVHQWFGDSVTPASWAHLWVSEGFATYFAAVYFGERDGPEAFREAMDGGRRSVIGSDASNRPVVDERPDLFGLLNSNSYPKGAWILHMLRSMLGDEAFFAGIRSYYEDHAEGSADTEDVRRAMEDASGEDLAWFFRQWAYSPGFPRLKVTTQGSEGATLVTLEQVQEPEWPTFRLPLVVELRAKDGRVDRREIMMEGRREILRFPWTAGEYELHVDPEDTLLMEVVGDEAEDEAAGS
jgi:aminopeptidase N